MKFEIGLTLTGTVSAGAYTGGVIDFILEAFEQWELQKKTNRDKYSDDFTKWSVPYHEVVIKGLSGASGGGVTCGILLNTVGRNFSPVKQPSVSTDIDNDFYNAWVAMLGIEELLEGKDIEGNKIRSLLNGKAIPAIADKILATDRFGGQHQRNYIDDHLFAILTVTNLRGVPYLVNFQGSAANQLIYYRHADYVKFEIAKDNKQQYPDAYLMINNKSDPDFMLNYKQLKAACLATCAFPAAFLAQPFSQSVAHYKARANNYPLNIPDDFTSFDFLSSDGGILNTEPFELLHKSMLPPGETSNPRSAKEVVRTIIMVAPLEVGDVFQIKYDLNDNELAKILPNVINSIRQEAMYTAQEIDLAFNENVYSRFIIAPTRSSSNTSTDKKLPAITGTTLGAFGAFISRDFREHDYFLGRRNAQQFLRKYFALPVDDAIENPIFKSLDIKNRFKDFIFTKDGKDYFPIVPLCGTANDPTYFPEWPAKKGYDLGKLENQVTNRIDELGDVLTASLDLNFFQRMVASLIIKKAKKSITEKTMAAITGALQKSDL